MRSNWNFHKLLLGIQNGTATLEKVLAVSYKRTRTLAIYTPAILPLGLDVYPREMKFCIYTKTCMQMFIAAVMD